MINVVKRVISALLSCALLCCAAVYSAGSYARFDLSHFNSCRKIFSYSGRDVAYFYGCEYSTLYSTRVFPNVLTRSVTVDGAIHAVCHDDNSVYALYQDAVKKYHVVKMNVDNGSCAYVDIASGEDFLLQGFAATNGEIFLIGIGQVFSFVSSFDMNGKAMYKYSVPMGVEGLFVNNSKAYVKAYSGEIYQISNGQKSYCAQFDRYIKFSNAGAGFIYTENNQLICLDNGNKTMLDSGVKNAVKTESGVFSASAKTLTLADETETDESGINLLAARGNSAAVLFNDMSCEIFECEEHIVSSESSKNNELRISDNTAFGIKAGTTVTQLKKQFDSDVTVLDKDGNAVTSGIIKTGFSVKAQSETYKISVRGDVTGTGTVSSNDVKSVMKFFIGESGLSGCYEAAADFNYDGVVDNLDLVLIAREIK